MGASHWKDQPMIRSLKSSHLHSLEGLEIELMISQLMRGSLHKNLQGTDFGELLGW